MHRTIQVNIFPGEEGRYVAEAVHLSVVTQGKTLDETIKNLREALSLHLEGEDMRELGFYSDAPVVITMEMAPVYA
jgi:predicted RNase H-like HicB family nuclease